MVEDNYDDKEPGPLDEGVCPECGEADCWGECQDDELETDEEEELDDTGEDTEV